MSTETVLNNETWTPNEIAAFYKIGLSTVYDEIAANRLKAARVGKRKGYRIDDKDRLKWWKSKELTPTKQEMLETVKQARRESPDILADAKRFGLI